MSLAPSTSSSDRSETRPARPLTRWIPVVLWAACISWFSTGAFSAQSTNSYIDPLLRRLFGELSPEGFRFAHTIIRKSAHFIEYAVLGILMSRALTEPGAPIPRRIVVKTIAYCALYASLDELHQTFVPSRTGSPYDVLLDAVGATVGTLVFTLVRRRQNAPPASAPPPRAARASARA